MATSRIALTYDPRTGGETVPADVTYWLKVTVGTDPEDLTTPAALDTCLVISKGSITTNEAIARVGSYDEIVDTLSPSYLPALPASVNYFESESLPADIQIGDVIRIPQGELPPRWVVYDYALTEYNATVDLVDLAHNRVRVATPFPVFGREIGFGVYRGAALVGSGTDGTANRDYTGLSGVYFRASEGITYYAKDLAAANSWRLAADSDAWALVKAYDTAEYSTAPETRIYEETT
jgi:hypothetical protein